MELRSTSDGQLLDGDIYFFIDASRHSEATFSSAFGPPDTRPKLAKNQLFVTLLQGSIQRRRELSRGYGQLDQLQTIHMFTGSPLKIVEQDRRAGVNSTNRGNLVGALPPPGLGIRRDLESQHC